MLPISACLDLPSGVSRSRRIDVTGRRGREMAEIVEDNLRGG
jgi:hypothetical protein